MFACHALSEQRLTVRELVLRLIERSWCFIWRACQTPICTSPACPLVESFLPSELTRGASAREDGTKGNGPEICYPQHSSAGRNSPPILYHPPKIRCLSQSGDHSPGVPIRGELPFESNPVAAILIRLSPFDSLVSTTLR